jgi:hypothetical protein
LLFVDVAGAIVLFVFDQQHRAIAAEQLNGAEPVGEVGVFFAFVGDEGIEGAFGEKELMGLVVDLLAAKVPDDWSRNSWPSSRGKRHWITSMPWVESSSGLSL